MTLSHFPPQALSVLVFFFFHFNTLVAMKDFKVSCKGVFWRAGTKKAFRVGSAVEEGFSDVQGQEGAAAYLCAAQSVS